MSNYRRSHKRQRARAPSRVRELASANLSPACAVELGAAPNPDMNAILENVNAGRAYHAAYRARIRAQVAEWNAEYRKAQEKSQ